MNIDPIIIIPFKNSSLRLPNKDEILFMWTRNFIYKTGVDISDVYTYGYVNDIKKAWLGNNSPYRHIELTQEEDCDHISATTAAISKLKLGPERIIVMLQLTQPKRDPRLLWDACRKVFDNPNISTVGYTAVDISGRVMNEQGQVVSSNDEIKLYDGSIYAGTVSTFKDWFDKSAEHNYVKNDELSVTDIDGYEDLTKHLVWR